MSRDGVREAQSTARRCRACAYVLDSLETHGLCPECGRAYDLNDLRTVMIGEPFLWWRYWMPGVGMALGIVLVFVIGAVALFQSWGVGAWGTGTAIGAPMAVGALLGWGARARLAGIVTLIIVLAVLTVGLVTVGVAGTFCVAILLTFLWIPAGLGWAGGFLVRDLVKAKGKWSQWRHLPAILAVAACTASVVAQRIFWTRCDVEVVTTSAEFNASPAEVWESIVFYEDAVQITGRSPTLLRLGLPRPVSSAGVLSGVGDTRTCVYSHGHLVKKVTEFEPERRLAFNVAEQTLMTHDARLVGGSIEIEAIDESRTRVTLSTSYEPLIRPRFCWRWAERETIRTLHGVVLDAMREEAEANEPSRARRPAVRQW